MSTDILQITISECELQSFYEIQMVWITQAVQHTLTRMQPQMHPQTALRGKQLLADVALEVLDPRVRADVRGQRALHRERTEALRALVGLLVGVDADVAHQVRRLLELLGAVGALVPPDAIYLDG